jgi:hypothetical protein
MAAAIVRRIDRHALTRLVAAGGAWGLAMITGLLAITIPQCGLPCPDVVAMTAAVCVSAGLLTIGPFAAFAGSK